MTTLLESAGLRAFTQNDWYGYGGCNSATPLIAHPHECDLIVDENAVSVYVWDENIDNLNHCNSWLREFGSADEAQCAACKMLGMSESMSAAEWAAFCTLVLGRPIDC